MFTIKKMYQVKNTMATHWNPIMFLQYKIIGGHERPHIFSNILLLMDK